MEENQITHFPESFGDLATLDILWCRFNQINALPESFGNLSDLNYLRISGNNLTSLPASFTSLATIEEIYIYSNQLEVLPEDFGILTTLKWLELGENNIQTIPESILDLQNLTYISFALNDLTFLPENIGSLTVDSLSLYANQIQELPASMFDNYYDVLWVDGNALQFGSIEPFMDNEIESFFYLWQARIGNDTTITAATGQLLNYTIEVSGEYNQYSWFKDSVIITGQNTNTLQLTEITEGDAGYYHLQVSNTIVPDLTLMSDSMELVVNTCIPWEFTTNSRMHTIFVPPSANPNINGEPLQDGDWIGVFFLNDENEETCGGATMWNSSGVEVLAYGDNPFAPGKDGFAEGEAFIWKMYKCSDQMEVMAGATYDPEMPDMGFYANQGSSALTSLSDEYTQSFALVAGWNGVSTFVVPDDPSVENIMAPVVNDLVIMQNLTQVYWPEEGLNTIGNWDNTSGYAMKFVNAASFEICGGEMADENLTIGSGWSYLPVPSACDVDVNQLLGSHLDDIVIVQDLIGTQVFWPAQGIYTLENLVPGKVYKIKTNNEINLTFPACENKTTSYVSRNNKLVTQWGDFNMTPSSENVVVFAEAITNLMAGDVVAAFNEYGRVCGMMEITNTKQNHSLILFGDDPTTTEADGFTEAEMISYKLYRMSTGEEFILDVEYYGSMENTTGLFFPDSFAGITNITTTITSIDEMDAATVSLYPNPANDVVSIDFGGELYTHALVSVYSTQGGNMVLQKRVTSGLSQINVGNLNRGIYFVKVETGSMIKNLKLIVK